MSGVDPDRLSQFVTKTKSLIEKNPQMNEANTKVKVIGPLLEILGWKMDSDVELEFPVRIGSATAKVDYALIIGDIPAILVEAKGFDSDIGNNDAEQAISYGRVLDVKWVVVTNGKSLHILDTKRGMRAQDCLFAKLSVDEFDVVDRGDHMLGPGLAHERIDEIYSAGAAGGDCHH
ncbi:MAG: type I restriction enzyme HsdR N-terminal domain-containing protein, partial [Methanomassiliicoccales archaeon]